MACTIVHHTGHGRSQPIFLVVSSLWTCCAYTLALYSAAPAGAISTCRRPSRKSSSCVKPHSTVSAIKAPLSAPCVEGGSLASADCMRQFRTDVHCTGQARNTSLPPSLRVLCTQLLLLGPTKSPWPPLHTPCRPNFVELRLLLMCYGYSPISPPPPPPPPPPYTPLPPTCSRSGLSRHMVRARANRR
jgi:hypothetical protein